MASKISRSYITDDVEMDAGIRKNNTYDVTALGSDSESQMSIIHR
jgi:hypothetical protein